jgi:hypothetical protein
VCAAHAQWEGRIKKHVCVTHCAPTAGLLCALDQHAARIPGGVRVGTRSIVAQSVSQSGYQVVSGTIPRFVNVLEPIREVRGGVAQLHCNQSCVDRLSCSDAVSLVSMSMAQQRRGRCVVGSRAQHVTALTCATSVCTVMMVARMAEWAAPVVGDTSEPSGGITGGTMVAGELARETVRAG